MLTSSSHQMTLWNRWYEGNAHTCWSGQELPGMEEMLKLSKGTRSLEQVKEYFRTYRKARRSQVRVGRRRANGLRGLLSQGPPLALQFCNAVHVGAE